MNNLEHEKNCTIEKIINETKKKHTTFSSNDLRQNCRKKFRNIFIHLQWHYSYKQSIMAYCVAGNQLRNSSYISSNKNCNFKRQWLFFLFVIRYLSYLVIYCTFPDVKCKNPLFSAIWAYRCLFYRHIYSLIRKNELQYI